MIELFQASSKLWTHEKMGRGTAATKLRREIHTRRDFSKLCPDVELQNCCYTVDSLPVASPVFVIEEVFDEDLFPV